MKTITVTCDGCGRDITTTGNCEDWRLKLANDPIPNPGPTATLLAISPPIREDKYFCGLKCLAKWLTTLE
jgi:hypothetical protein